MRRSLYRASPASARTIPGALDSLCSRGEVLGRSRPLARLDEGGCHQPLPGLTLHFCRSSLIGPGGAEAKTDTEGRFHVTGLAPGQRYWLTLANRPQVRVHADAFALKPGETKELGDLLIEPSR